MDSGLFIFLVMLFAAVPLYVIAYLIGVKKRVGLISPISTRTGSPTRMRWLAGWG